MRYAGLFFIIHYELALVLRTSFSHISSPCVSWASDLRVLMPQFLSFAQALRSPFITSDESSIHAFLSGILFFSTKVSFRFGYIA